MSLLMSLLMFACVIDRTGQSATENLRKELADHGERIATMEVLTTDLNRRLTQLEEVARARGQEEILKMETMEQIRQEVARMRGDLEVLRRDYDTSTGAGSGFQADADWRLRYYESRIANLEKSLRITPPAAPCKDTPDQPCSTTPCVPTPDKPCPDATAVSTPTTGTTGTAGTTTPSATVEETFSLIATHLSEGRASAARAVAEGFIKQSPQHERVPEAYYRVAESYQNEKNFQTAAAKYQVVIDKYPKSAWAPWAILRQGECFASMGMRKEAEIFWKDVIRAYPDSKAAKEAKTLLASK